MDSGRKNPDPQRQVGVYKLTNKTSENRVDNVTAADHKEPVPVQKSKVTFVGKNSIFEKGQSSSSSTLDTCNQKSEVPKSFFEAAKSVGQDLGRAIPIAANSAAAQGFRPLNPRGLSTAPNRPLNSIGPRRQIPTRVAANSGLSTRQNVPTNTSSQFQRTIIKEEDAEDVWDNAITELRSLGRVFANTEYDGGTNLDYAKCRNPVDELLKMHDVFLKSAEDAAKNGRVDEARFYTEQTVKIKKRADKAARVASTTMFDASNRLISNEIAFDLHGQHRETALIILQFFIWFGRNSRSVCFFEVCTGHCIGRKKEPVLLKEVKAFLTRQRIRHWPVGDGTIGFKIAPTWKIVPTRKGS